MGTSRCNQSTPKSSLNLINMFSSLSSSSSLIPIICLSLISVIRSHEAPADGFFKREHSLVKPYSPAGMNIPFFDLTGDTMVTNNFVRITPDDKSRSGGIWNKVPMNQRAWEVHFTYSAFNNFGPASKFGHFRGFWSEIFGQKVDLSKLPNETSPKGEPEMLKIDSLAKNFTPKTTKMTKLR